MDQIKQVFNLCIEKFNEHNINKGDLLLKITYNNGKIIFINCQEYNKISHDHYNTFVSLDNANDFEVKENTTITSVYDESNNRNKLIGLFFLVDFNTQYFLLKMENKSININKFLSHREEVYVLLDYISQLFDSEDINTIRLHDNLIVKKNGENNFDFIHNENIITESINKILDL